MSTPARNQAYGWYSPYVASLGITMLWETLSGVNVTVTNVSYSATHSGLAWPDCRLVGPVNEFVRCKDCTYSRSVSAIKCHARSTGPTALIRRQSTDDGGARTPNPPAGSC
nr:hypothetical protein [Pandoravirus massiliensis]